MATTTKPRRALLIGVPEYRNKRPEQKRRGSLIMGPLEWVDKSMPSARNDVAAFKAMLIRDLKFSESDITVLLEPEQTTREYILGQLKAFFTEVPQHAQLVLYFSGHASRISATGLIDGALGWKDEVLCPSDTDWAGIFITDREVMEMTTEMPRVGASLEIVLESCSASGLNDGQLTRRFGKRDRPAFAPENRAHDIPASAIAGATAITISEAPIAPANPFAIAEYSLIQYLDAMKGRCVFWGASLEGTCSYSGPKTADGRGESMGLFTRFFTEGRANKDRGQLVTYIRDEIAKYRAGHRAWHAEQLPDPDCMDTPQTPYVDYFDDPTAATKEALS